MKKHNVKFLSLLLVLVMVLGMIPVSVSAATTPATVTVAQAQTRLNNLINMFHGKYFTVNQTYCTVGSHSSEHDNCLMSKVVATSWVKNLVGMGTLDYSLFPAQYNYDGSKWSVNGWQCYGFANFAHWYVFAKKNTDNLVSTLVTKGKMNYSTMSKALPGDVIRTDWLGGHSMVFVSCDSSGFTVLDCNYKDNATGQYACQVKLHKVSYNSNYSVAITGVENYDRSSKTVPVTGISLSTSTLSMVVGATKSVTATVSPSNATNKTVTWTSSNASVATVSTSGVIKGVSQGTATITAKTQDGGYTARVTVTVEPNTYDVSFWLIGGQWSYGDAFIVDQGDYFYIPNEIPVRDGHAFMYWENIMSTNDDIYYPGNYYTDDTDAIFMAVWEKLLGWYWQDGYWYYGTEDGNYVGWLLDGGTWYYLYEDGKMAIGWVLDGSTWYYMNGSGAMQTGWVYDGNAWYYMNGSGAMQTGWVNDGGRWYYMNGSGAMQTGWVNDRGTWYYMNGSGAMHTGWLYLGNTWYFLSGSGAMMTGWQNIGGVWYLFSGSGAWVG